MVKRYLIRDLYLVVLLGHVTVGSMTLYSQTQVTIGANKDNTLYESATGALSNGAGQHFFAGRTFQVSGSIRRGLIAFDIAGTIPSGATILSVTLTLSMSKSQPGTHTVSLHRVLADWGEGTSVAGGNEGGGAPSSSGDATWIHRFFNTSSWATIGGDFSSTASASQSVSGIGMYTWGPTAAMVADVQGWLNTPSNNFGWLLKGNESSGGTAKRFDTRENGDPAARPLLTVTYDPGVAVRENPGAPLEFALMQNYPNPFNPSTNIRFTLDASGFTLLQVCDVLGREVATLVNEVKEPGSYMLTWDASGLVSGVYFYTLRSGQFTQTRRLMLIR
jgi:hypothetical protein